MGGEIVGFRLPTKEDNTPKGIAFITFKDKQGVEKALEFNETDYGGRMITVERSGDRKETGKGGKDGKGKGKGKDKGKSKGKGKGKKGKKGKDDDGGSDGEAATTADKRQARDADEDAILPPTKKTKTSSLEGDAVATDVTKKNKLMKKKANKPAQE